MDKTSMKKRLAVSLFLLVMHLAMGLKAHAGSVVAWGSMAVDSNDFGGANFIVVAAGGYHNLGLKADGSIMGWGGNGSGQATPPSRNDFVAVSGGAYYSLALKADGSIAGWGEK